jgi:hypothetical protein
LIISLAIFAILAGLYVDYGAMEHAPMPAAIADWSNGQYYSYDRHYSRYNSYGSYGYGYYRRNGGIALDIGVGAGVLLIGLLFPYHRRYRSNYYSGYNSYSNPTDVVVSEILDVIEPDRPGW